MLKNKVLPDCPACGKTPIVLSESVGEDGFFVIRCPDPNCPLYNEDTYDNLEACKNGWLTKITQYTSFSEKE